MRHRDSGFLADGRERVRRTEEYKAARQRLMAEVRAHYSEDLDRPNPLRRLAAWLKVRREVYRRLEGVAPTRGLYLRAP